ncbi:hypothetical protein [Microbacterium lacticum]
MRIPAVTEALLSLAAEEVLVDIVTTSLDVGQHHPAGAFFLMALATEQAALQVVLVDALPLTGRAGRDDFLDACEQFGLDEWFVSPFEDLALVGHEADVVRVLQDPE